MSYRADDNRKLDRTPRQPYGVRGQASDRPRHFDNHLTGARQNISNSSLGVYQQVRQSPPQAPQPSTRLRPNSSGDSRIRPRDTDVFQHGSDGKLYPIPGWHTTGPFDVSDWSRNIDWGGVAGDLGEIAGGSTGGMGAGALAEQVVKGLGYKIGPAVVRGIINGHHTLPKFMGGPVKQRLFKIHRSLHDDLHAELAKAYKQVGFPKIGGRGGGAEVWKVEFARNPQRRTEAIDILRRVTREFDRKNGTKISPYLDGEISKMRPPS